MDIDLDFNNLTKEEIKIKYLDNLEKLKKYALNEKIHNENQFFHYLNRFYYQKVHKNNNTRSVLSFILSKNTSKVIIKSVINRKRKILNIFFGILAIFTLFIYKHEFSSLISRNFQNYHVIKLWRKATISMQLLNFYPSLTDLYDESCLISNPYFQVKNLNCDPCSDVVNVLDFTDLTQLPSNYKNIPFIIKTLDSTVDVEALHTLYMENEEVFKKDAFKLKSSNENIKNLEDLFQDFLNTTTNQKESHNLWRSNRMPPARLLRQLFPRPKQLPSTGLSLERFLSIDSPLAPPFRIPDAECSTMFMIQGHGSRIILLRPTQECRNVCKTLSVKLPAKYALVFNWLYWKPISMPAALSITHHSLTFIGSYC